MPGKTVVFDVTQLQDDARQRHRLKVMRRAATGLLLLMAGLFALAQANLGQHPAWAWVRAFAEAAMVGAMADWFAVVALFRRPLGLPIWHTAILPNKKDEIARSLGEFVESHFVTVEAIVARIRSFDPATRLSQWLVQPQNADKLGKLLTAAARQILASVDDDQIRSLLRTAITKRLDAIELAGPVADFGFELMAKSATTPGWIGRCRPHTTGWTATGQTPPSAPPSIRCSTTNCSPCSRARPPAAFARV